MLLRLEVMLPIHDWRISNYALEIRINISALNLFLGILQFLFFISGELCRFRPVSLFSIVLKNYWKLKNTKKWQLCYELKKTTFKFD